jgi:hypothetical protein
MLRRLSKEASHLALQLGWPYGDTPTVVMTKKSTAVVHEGERGVLLRRPQEIGG